MKVLIFKGFWTEEDAKKYFDYLFIFGDNDLKKGKKGQAVIRDENNAIGIPTKKKPFLSSDSFYSDLEFEENKTKINSAISKIKNKVKNYKGIIFPENIGTGLAKLNIKAPLTYSYLLSSILTLKKELTFKNSLKKEKMELVYNLKWKIGAHTTFSGKICDTLWTSINYGMNATQFFMGSPQSFARAKISDKDLSECKKILDRFPMSVFTHFPYIANLAGTAQKSIAWTGNKEQDSKTIALLKNVEYEVNMIARLGVKQSGVVIHPGAHTKRKEGLQAIAKSINRIKFEKGAKLLLENCAGEGNKLAKNLTELKQILDFVEESKKENVGICIDTCHAFASGEYNLSKTEEVDRLFEEFENILGLKYFSLLHLNDSCGKHGCCTDRHELIGKGEIWGKNQEGLIHLLNKCSKYNIPAVLETHGSDMIILSRMEREYFKN